MNGSTFLVAAIVAVLLVLCLRSSVKHFTGQSSCCGGGGEPRVKPKKLAHTVGRFTLRVDGMRCDSCKRRVMAAVNALDGYAAKVDLEHKTVTVSYESEGDREKVAKAIEAAGYEVVEKEA